MHKFRVVAAALALLPACTTGVQRRDWSTYTGPGAEYFRQPEYALPYQDDPLEPFNRVMIGANHLIFSYLVHPVSVAWRFIIPQCVRTPLVRAAYNLGYPGRAVNCLLQGKFKEAGEESHRFLANTTVGVLGLWDPATDWGIPRANTDTGMTFNVWGWHESTFLGLPLLGPSTSRDGLGRVGDYFLDPCAYFFPALPVKMFIVGSEHIDGYIRFVDTQFDAYDEMRLLWMASRQILDQPMDVTVDDDGVTQTVHCVELEIRDPWFPYRASTRRVKIPATGRKLAYELWLQSKPAPLVYFLPGLGAHRRSQQSVVMAEMFYGAGFSVVTLSSTMSFDFMESAATVDVPGYTPADVEDLRGALAAVHEDVLDRHGSRVTGTVLAGLSLGGLQALHIAALQGRGGGPVTFERVTAINPPVDMRWAGERIDAYYNVPLQWPEEQREDRVSGALQEVMQALQTGSAGSAPLTLSRQNAEFLIGLSYRAQLHDVIWVSQERSDMGVLSTPLKSLQRSAATQEIMEYGYVEYFYAFVLPYFEQRQMVHSPEEVFERMGLRSVGDALRPLDSVQVFTNENDFLLRSEDLQWLRTQFGTRLTVFPRGGHLGNLDDPEVRQAILQSLTVPAAS